MIGGKKDGPPMGKSPHRRQAEGRTIFAMLGKKRRGAKRRGKTHDLPSGRTLIMNVSESCAGEGEVAKRGRGILEGKSAMYLEFGNEQKKGSTLR